MLYSLSYVVYLAIPCRTQPISVKPSCYQKRRSQSPCHMLSKDAGSLQIVYARNSVYVFMGNRYVGGSHWMYLIEVYYSFKRRI